MKKLSKATIVGCTWCPLLCISDCLSLSSSSSVFLSLSLSLSVSLSFSSSTFLCLSISFFIFVYLSLPLFLPLFLFVYLSLYLSLYVSLPLPVCLSVCLSVSLSLSLSASLLSISASMFLWFPICLNVYNSLPLLEFSNPLINPLPPYLSTCLSNYLPTRQVPTYIFISLILSSVKRRDKEKNKE